MTHGAYQSDRSDSNADTEPAWRTISRLHVLPGDGEHQQGGSQFGAARFTANQFSLFPENCRDWSIEMKWAGDITPRKNFGKDR